MGSAFKTRGTPGLSNCENQDSVEITAYRDLLNRMDAIDAWLCSRGLNHQTDRVRRNRADVAQLTDAFEAGRLDRFIKDAGDDRRRELMWSLAESMEFVDSVEALQAQNCEMPNSVVQKALDGPANPLDESETSNLGRNTMFEIALAGRLARAGLRPTLGQEPDIHVEYNQRNIFIQCKRVFSAAAVAKRLGDAAKQLKRDLGRSCSQRDCGIIAISVSRVFNPGDKLLAARDEGGVRDKLHAEIDGIIRANIKNYRDVKEPKIAGVLYHLSTPAYLEGVGMYMGAHSVTVVHIEGKSDRALLENLAGSLGTH